MSANMRITNVEHELGDSETLVFRANLEGIIIFADCNFIEISGFKEGELYGKSHNLVRHPDMPQAVFMDMLDSVTSGRTWMGIIKNRCKNGDFYWAHATVSPVRAGRMVTGYMSVYRKPTRPQIGEACRLYQQINEGMGAELRLSSLAGSPGKLSLPHNLSTNSHFILILAIASLLLICAGAAGLYETAQQHNTGMRNTYIGLAIAGLLISAWASFLLARIMMRPLKKTIRPAAVTASNEQASSKIDPATKNEAGRLARPIRPIKDNNFRQTELAGNTRAVWQQSAKQAGKTPAGMKEKDIAIEQRTENTVRTGQVACNLGDDSIKRGKRAIDGISHADADAGKAVEGIVVAVKRVANIMAEISAVSQGQGKTDFRSDKPDKLASGQKPIQQAGERVAKLRPLRAVREEDDEWKDF